MIFREKTRASQNCYWCGTETFPHYRVPQAHPKLATRDHIRSKPECLSAAEYNHPSNQVTACFACNQRRSLEWCKRRDAGLVHPTEWSIKQAAKEARRRAKKKAKRIAVMMSLPPVRKDFTPFVNVFAPPTWEQIHPPL